MPRGSPTLDSFGDPTHPLIIGLRHKQAYVALGIGVVQQLNTRMREILGTCETYPSSLLRKRCELLFFFPLCFGILVLEAYNGGPYLYKFGKSNYRVTNSCIIGSFVRLITLRTNLL